LFDLANRSSVAACITGARDNARQVREEISSEMWEQLNGLYLAVRQIHGDTARASRPHYVCRTVIEGIHLFQGITDATMGHGEGWQYLQAGRFIERAAVTAVLLDEFFIDRAKPGVIAVMRDGARFANEGNSYHDFVQQMMKAAKSGEEIAAFLICDHKTLRKYGLGCVPPFPMPIGHHLETGYLKRGDTIASLAAQAGIDAKALEATIAQFNASAASGQDAAFGKGSRAYNRFQGDALHGPNPCIGPVEHRPFYAIKMVIGDLGTYAGLKTDENARALDGNGQAIDGLYAAGNDMASIMGGNYPGAGITLGPALTFGYIAGRHIAGDPQVAKP